MIKKLISICVVAIFVVIIDITVTFVGLDGGITIDEECLMRCVEV